MSRETAPRHRRQTGAMAADRRATRLGVLAVVAVLLFGADRYAAVVPADGPGRVAAADRRRRKHQDGAGCCPSGAASSTSTAASSPTTSASSRSPSTGTCIRKRHRRLSSSAACRAGSTCRSRTWRRASTPSSYSRVPADAAKEDVEPRRRGRARASAPRTSRRRRSSTSGSGSIRTPRCQPRLGYMGAITGGRAGLQGPRLRHRSTSGSAVRRRAEHGERAARHVGRGGLRGRRRQPHVRLIEHEPAGQRLRHPARDRPRRSAVRRARAETKLARSARIAARRTRRSRKPDGTRERWTPTQAVGRGVVQGTGRLVVVDEPPDGQIIAMASYPTFDNRWFSAGLSGDEVRRDLPDRDATARRSTPTSRSSSTAPCRAGTTWARRSSRSPPSPP